MNNKKKLTKWVLIGLTILSILILSLFYFLSLKPSLIFIFLLSIMPIFFLNFYLVFLYKVSKKIKWLFSAISSLIVLLYSYFAVVYFPTQIQNPKKFNTDEFGVLVYKNYNIESIRKISDNVLKKSLKMLEKENNESCKKIDIIFIKRKFDFCGDSEIMKSYIIEEVCKCDANIGIYFDKISGDSCFAKIFISPMLIKDGLLKEEISLQLLKSKLNRVIKNNIETIYKLSNGENFDNFLTNFLPTTKIEKIIKANMLYKQGTAKLKEALSLNGSSSERNAKLDSAELAFKESVQLDTLNDKSYALLGYLYLKVKSDYSSASYYYKKSRSISPGNYNYTWNLAQSYRHNGKVENAIKILDGYLKKYGESIKDDGSRMEMERLLKSWKRI